MFNVQALGRSIAGDDSVQAMAVLDSSAPAKPSIPEEAARMFPGDTALGFVGDQGLCGCYVLLGDPPAVLDMAGEWVSGADGRQWSDVMAAGREGAGFISRAGLKLDGVRRDVTLYVQHVPDDSDDSRAMAVIAVDMTRFIELMLPRTAGE